MSETAKHTPGPWMLDPQYLSEVQTAALKTIASCWHEHADGATITVTGVLPCSLAESAANARLIAAAPDLLEALKGLFEDYKNLADSGDAGFWKLENLEVGKTALAAIAKAEGRS